MEANSQILCFAPGMVLGLEVSLDLPGPTANLFPCDLAEIAFPSTSR